MTRGEEPGSGSPQFCEHANEVPSACACPRWCYCQTRTCAPGKPCAPLRIFPAPVGASVRDPIGGAVVWPVGWPIVPAGPVTVEAFEAHVAATECREDGTRAGLDYCCLKLAAEAGEVGQIRGKELLNRTEGHDTIEGGGSVARRARYALELGDTAWYVAEDARLLDMTFEQVLRINVAKLRWRRTHDRDPEAEQQLAEQILLEDARRAQATVAPDLAHVPAAPGPSDQCGFCGALCLVGERCPAREGGPAIRKEPDEFRPCAICGDLTRHIGHVEDRPGIGGARPLCRARECRKQAVK